jgi:hypothetical protein
MSNCPREGLRSHRVEGLSREGFEHSAVGVYCTRLGGGGHKGWARTEGWAIESLTPHLLAFLQHERGHRATRAPPPRRGCACALALRCEHTLLTSVTCCASSQR